MKLVKSVLSASILAAAAQSAVAVEITPYAGIQVEYQFDDQGGRDSDGGIDDSYSRVGIKASEEFEGFAVNYKFETGVDATGEGDNKILDDGTVRVNRIQVTGDFGTIAYGLDWTPFYNEIDWGTGSDRFLGYYSGFQTQYPIRSSETLFYTSPDLNGLKVSMSYGQDSTSCYDGTSCANDKELVLTYTVNENLTVVAANTDGDADSQKRNGFGLRYTVDAWTFTLNNQDADTGLEHTNAYVGYALSDADYIGAHISESTASDADGNTKTNPFTLGYSHKYNDALTVFAEYYDNDAGGEYPQVGVHYNF